MLNHSLWCNVKNGILTYKTKKKPSSYFVHSDRIVEEATNCSKMVFKIPFDYANQRDDTTLTLQYIVNVF